MAWTSVPVWQNASGVVDGHWVRREGSSPRTAMAYNLSDMAPAVTWAGADSEWSRNVTGEYGTITMRIEDKAQEMELQGSLTSGHPPRSVGLVREVAVVTTIQDDATGSSSWDMRLHGVHWPRQGIILVTTTSDKFAGIFGLPHLTLGRDFFTSSQALINRTLSQALLEKEQGSELGDPSKPPWASSGGVNDWNPSPHCEYLLYVQIHPIDYQQLKLRHFGAQDRERLAVYIHEIERELQHPTGAPIKAIPKLRLSFVAWSPDCSFYLESKGPPIHTPAEGQHLVGMKDELLLHEGRFWLLLYAGVLFAQAQLLKSQMRESSTPSTMGRVSFYTAAMMLLADGLVFVFSAALSLSATNAFLASLVLTFAALMSVMMGSVFMSDVYKTQEPERRRRERERGQAAAAIAAAAAAATATTTTAADADVVAAAAADGSGRGSGSSSSGTTTLAPRPPAVSVSTDPRPIILPSDQDIEAEIVANTALGASALPLSVTASTGTTTMTTRDPPQPRLTPLSSVTGRLLLVGTLVFFLSVSATAWPARLRSLYANMLAFAYLSLWIPQIWRNVQRNSRRAFAWRFMVGQSGLRLLPLAYVYVYRDNMLFARPEPRAFLALTAWVWLQLWALAAQDVLGPRFSVPKHWMPEAWDYHPILREDDAEGGGLPIGLLGSDTGASPLGSPTAGHDEHERRQSASLSEGRRNTCIRRSLDCAICREVLEVPVVRAGADDPTGGGVAGILQRRAYMATPCRHMFHATCLEGWLRYRLQCPICREELPPL